MIYWKIDLILPFFILLLLTTSPVFSQVQSGLQSSQGQYDRSNHPILPDRNKLVRPATSQTKNFPDDSLVPEFGKPLPEAVQPGIVNSIDAGLTVIAKRLGLLEQTIFGSTYYEHDPVSRLEHLERDVLGSVWSGNPDLRLAKLESIVLGRSGFGSGETPTRQNSATAIPAATSDVSIANAISFDAAAGDYIDNIQSQNVGQFAHWAKFPIHIHLPQGSPEQWQKSLLKGIDQWNQYIPIVTSSLGESADIEIVWVNHLVPNLLGVTRLVIVTGRMHVEVFMLRPSFYPKDVSEKTVEAVFLHEMGHALGLFGHSEDSTDIMYPIETINDGKVRTRNRVISARDLNTLRKVYQSGNYPAGFTSPRPMEWGGQQ